MLKHQNTVERQPDPYYGDRNINLEVHAFEQLLEALDNYQRQLEAIRLAVLNDRLLLQFNLFHNQQGNQQNARRRVTAVEKQVEPQEQSRVGLNRSSQD